MAWAYVITKDHINKNEGESNKGRRRRSVSAANDKKWGTNKEITSDPEAIRFSLYDDDGICYYEGYYVETEDSDSYNIFRPLDWAMYDSGCTTMKIRNEAGEMAPL